MKILHTSDWHLGRLLHERPLIEDQKHALDQIIRIIKEKEHDVLIIAGDIFDRSIPSIEGIRLLGWFFAELRSFSSLPVLIIPGNHDSAARLSYCSELLSVSGIYIQGDPIRATEPLIMQQGLNARLFMVPYLESDIFADAETEIKKFTHEDAMRKILDRIPPSADERSIDVFVGHLFTSGGTSSDSERKFIGAAGMIDPSLFSRFSYTALGHLHRPQKIGDTVWYSGSPLKYSFSESDDRKMVLSATITKDMADIEQLKIEPLRDMARIRGTLSDLLKGREHAAAEKCYCEAELADPGLVSNPLAILRQRFPYILSVRQASPQAVFSERMIEAFKPERSIEDDFVSFKQYLYGEKPADHEMKLFRDICLEKGEQ